MTDILRSKIVFLTGGSGFLGTTLVSRLVFDTNIDYVYILVRGGKGHLFSKWAKVLPSSVLSALEQSEKIIAIEGDITRPSLGMTLDDQTRVRESHYIIHAASSVSLAAPLSKIMPSIIQGSIEVANFSSCCPNLEQFVYVSTAYANAHLHQLHAGVETVVKEQVYLLGDKEGIRGAEEEYRQLKLYGTTSKYEAFDFPWAYAYAKHLTERLLMQLFPEDSPENLETRGTSYDGRRKLLIVRPSIIGPAKKWPYPSFEKLGSVPSSSWAATLMISSSRYMKFSTRFTDPWNETNANEISVDSVANQIIMHMVYNTTGIVHAVCPDEDRITFSETWTAVKKVRRLPWTPKIKWKNVHWHSEELDPMARLFVIHGTSYSFSRIATLELQEKMSQEEREKFPMYMSRRDGIYCNYTLNGRGKAILENAEWYFRRRGWPLWIASWLCARIPR